MTAEFGTNFGDALAKAMLKSGKLSMCFSCSHADFSQSVDPRNKKIKCFCKVKRNYIYRDAWVCSEYLNYEGVKNVG